MIILTLIVFFIILFKVFHFIYLYQIKEHRWDRLHSTIKETGWFTFLYNTQFRRPAATSRNMLIALIATASIVVFMRLFRQNRFPFLIFIAPQIAFIATSIGVYLTGFLASYQRNKIIERAKTKVANSKAICIGITGTYGKSSVKEFVYQVLSAGFNVGKTDKNMNTDVGIALSVLNNLKDNTEYFVTEYGAYKIGEIEDACQIIRPTISVLTGLGNQHLDLYGSRENLVRAETYILNILGENDSAYINLDFPESRGSVKNVKSNKVFYSLKEGDIQASEITHKDNKQHAKIEYKNEVFHIESALVGRHNILNLLPAIAIAHDLGMKKRQIIEAVNSITPIQGKLSIHKGFNQSTIVNDSYNSVVNGFIAMIDVIDSLPQSKKYIVSKGIIELGVEKRSSYRLILDKLAKTDIILLTTDPVFQQENREGTVKTLNDESQIIDSLKNAVGPETVIGIEGRFTHNFVNQLII